MFKIGEEGALECTRIYIKVEMKERCFELVMS